MSILLALLQVRRLPPNAVPTSDSTAYLFVILIIGAVVCGILAFSLRSATGLFVENLRGFFSFTGLMTGAAVLLGGLGYGAGIYFHESKMVEFMPKFAVGAAIIMAVLSCIINLGMFQEGRKIDAHHKELRRIAEEKERQEQIEKERIEASYLAWCDQQDDAERILQPLCDALVNRYQTELNGLPRIKVVVGTTDNNADGQYHPGFRHYRKPGEQQILINSSAFFCQKIEGLEYILKHELVHAWVDWREIEQNDAHGMDFQKKAKELGL